jgi:hypothetical protein
MRAMQRGWMQRGWMTLAVVAGCLSAVSAQAAPRFEVTPFVGYRAGGDFEVDEGEDSSRSVDLSSDASFGIDLGLYRDSSSFYELLYSRQEAGLESSDPALDDVKVNTDYLHFGGTLLFDHEAWYEPYLSLTVGATRLDPKDGGYDSETKFSASLGGGFRFPFNDRVAALLGVRGYLTFIGSDTKLFCASGPLGSSCLVTSSGSTYSQFEGQLGLTVRF